MKTIKLVFVGDGAVGKTGLIKMYTTKQFPFDLIESALDNDRREVLVETRHIDLHIWDTGGCDDIGSYQSLIESGNHE
jgi:GTPase SAR1 family protein